MKTFESLPLTVQARVRVVIAGLSSAPRPVGVKKLSGQLKGIWRVRTGDWRILYDIDDQARNIILIDIGLRKSVYR